ATQRDAADLAASGPHRSDGGGLVGDRHRERGLPVGRACSHPHDLAFDAHSLACNGVTHRDGCRRQYRCRLDLLVVALASQQCHRQPTRARRTSSSTPPVTNTNTSSPSCSTVSPRGTTTWPSRNTATTVDSRGRPSSVSSLEIAG